MDVTNARHRTTPIARLAALLAVGAATLSPRSAAAEEPLPSEPPRSAPVDDHESAPMMYAGMALTITGTAGLAVGTGVFAVLSQESGDFAGLGAALIGGAILIPSTVLVHIGIPLWAVGGAQPGQARPSGVPEWSLGPSGGSLTWSF